MMFVLVLLVFTYPYFIGGNTQMMSAGFIVVVGLLLSILLHELGHAFAGRLFRAKVSQIELTGLGGIAHFERSLPRSALARSLIYLAGPAVNLGLWQGLGWLAGRGGGNGQPDAVAAARGAGVGQLLPDVLQPAAGLSARRGPGRWMRGLGALLGPTWSVRIVACLGLAVAFAVGLYALPTGVFHAVRRILPGAGELGCAAERRRLVAK